MMSLTRLVFLVLLIIVTFNQAQSGKSCPAGRFKPRGHSNCTRCQNCGDFKVIRPCTATQDAFCSDELRTKVVHFPCYERSSKNDLLLGLFLEDRIPALQHMKKKTLDKTHIKACGVIKHYEKRLLYSRKLLSQGDCPKGTYKRKSKFHKCHECSKCPSESHEVYSCGTMQDTVCSFPRVNDTIELFRFICNAKGTTVQIYSSKRALLPQYRLDVISKKLHSRLCRILKRAKPRSAAAHESTDIKARTQRTSTPSVRAVRVNTTVITPTSKMTPSSVLFSTLAAATTTAAATQTTAAAVRTAAVRTAAGAGSSMSTVSSPRKASASTSLSTSSLLKTDTNMFPGTEASFEETASNVDQDQKTISTPGLIGLIAGLSCLVVMIIAGVCITINRTRIHKALGKNQSSHSWTSGATNCEFSDEAYGMSSVAHSEKNNQGHSDDCGQLGSKPRKIVDPLRLKKRPKSYDSGYTTESSRGSDQLSRPVCRESQSVSTSIQSCRGADELLLGSSPTVFTRKGSLESSVRDSTHDDLVNPWTSLTDDSPAHPHLRSDIGPTYLEMPSYPADLTLDMESKDGAIQNPCLSPVYDASYLAQLTLDMESKDGAIQNPCLSPVYDASSKLNPGERYSSIFHDVQRLSFDSCFSDESITDLIANERRISFPSAAVANVVHLENLSDQVVSSGSDSPTIAYPNEVLSLKNSKRGDSRENPRKRSGDSSSSAVSSSVSMRINVPFKKKAAATDFSVEWLQKESTIGPENCLSTYTSSMTTQTDDWDKSNLRAKPTFCASWQGSKSFSTAGGTWTLPNSDLKLVVPGNAVLSGSYADVSAATYTNLPHLRQALNLTDEEVFVGPLAELDAGSGFRFQENIEVHYPHCLPNGVKEIHVKLHHVEKSQTGGLLVRLLQSKKDYKQKRAKRESRNSKEPLNSGDEYEPEEDLGFYEFLPSGELVVYTRRFCGYICSVCKQSQLEPQIRLVATAGQHQEPRRSGELHQVSLRLYLWDRKINITDFRRDNLKNEVVEEKTLSAVQDFENSLVKMELTFYNKDYGDEETECQWKHAIRPNTPKPIFPAVKDFSLRELLCCHAKDSPRCEEWLAENFVKTGEPFYDFQCIIDVENTVSSQPLDESDGRSRMSKQVTLFIRGVNVIGRFEATKNVPEQLETYGRGVNNYANTSQGQKEASQQPSSHVSDKDQDNEYFQNWEPLSDEINLALNPSRHSIPPTRPPSIGRVGNQGSSESGRPLSCPASSSFNKSAMEGPQQQSQLTVIAEEKQIRSEPLTNEHQKGKSSVQSTREKQHIGPSTGAEESNRKEASFGNDNLGLESSSSTAQATLTPAEDFLSRQVARPRNSAVEVSLRPTERQLTGKGARLKDSNTAAKNSMNPPNWQLARPKTSNTIRPTEVQLPEQHARGQQPDTVALASSPAVLREDTGSDQQRQGLHSAVDVSRRHAPPAFVHRSASDTNVQYEQTGTRALSDRILDSFDENTWTFVSDH